MNRRGFIAILFATLLIPFFREMRLAAEDEAGAEAARAQADAFVSQARGYLASGSLEQASALLASAFDISPEYSEALFLRALIELKDRASTRAAMADLRRAVARRSWKQTDPAAAEQVLSEVLLRTGKLAEARPILRRLTRAHPEDSRNFLLLARLHAKAGDTAGEGAVLAEARTLFPLEDDFAFLSADLLERLGPRGDAREIVATMIKVHPDTLPLLLRAARMEPNGRKRLAAVDLYARKGGTDPLSAALGMEGSAKDAKKYLPLFLEQGGLARQDLVERALAATAGNKELTRVLVSALSQYSGNRDLDGDGDGFYEERWAFEAGVPSRWIWDADQDGVPEFTADFERGAASTLAWEPQPGVTLTVRYSAYPFIESVREISNSAPRVFSLVPYTLRCSFLAENASKANAGTAPRRMLHPLVPTLDQVRRAAYRMEELSEDGTIAVRRFFLSHGEPVYMEESTRSDGTFDHRLWYVGGKPYRGSRDLDGDGVFEVSETWRDGKPAGQTVDTDGDGIPDYREVFGAKPARYWDYNEDGRADSREFPVEGGKVIRDFSTALDGRYNLRLVFDGSGIVEVTRNGISLPVVHDTARGVVWIGGLPEAAAFVEPSIPEGFHAIGGNEYLAFRFGGNLYMEKLP